MIAELTVENLAIIERSQLSLGPGFTVLTGETGAGKSLLIDAIELAIGQRADTELVRTGARSAAVHVALDLSGSPSVLARCAALGVECEDGQLFIHREVLTEGRSVCRINGKSSPVSTLRQIGQILVDLHGQHDHQSLLDPASHVRFLDEWIGSSVDELKECVAGDFAAFEDAKKRLAALKAGLRDREQRLDLLRFQLNEIEAASPQPGEIANLESQLGRLKHVSKLAEACAMSLSQVADSEANAIDLVAAAVRALEDAAKFDPGIDDVAAPLREALYQLQDGTHGLRAYADALETDPVLLEETAARIDELKRLLRKYGDTEAHVLEFLENVRGEIEVLENSEASEEELAEAVDMASHRLLASCSRLTELRKERSIQFAALVQTELRDLAMEKAEFSVDIRPREPGPDGADDIEFFFSANAGELPRPLSKIASGGEISRVMLAIKTGSAGRAGVPTLIFDEVDAGLGGRAAATVARKLQQLSQHYQVIVISHLPQIAGRADEHYRIEKAETAGRVSTTVRRLDDEERVQELARMLAGEVITESAVGNARELLRTGADQNPRG